MKITRRYKSIFTLVFLMLFASLTTIFAQQSEGRKFDEYGKIRTKDENARLDNLVMEMNADTNSTAYIISYGGRRSGPNDAQMMANKAKTYILKKSKFKSTRIMTINGGY